METGRKNRLDSVRARLVGGVRHFAEVSAKLFASRDNGGDDTIYETITVKPVDLRQQQKSSTYMWPCNSCGQFCRQCCCCCYCCCSRSKIWNCCDDNRRKNVLGIDDLQRQFEQAYNKESMESITATIASQPQRFCKCCPFQCDHTTPEVRRERMNTQVAPFGDIFFGKNRCQLLTLLSLVQIMIILLWSIGLAGFSSHIPSLKSYFLVDPQMTTVCEHLCNNGKFKIVQALSMYEMNSVLRSPVYIPQHNVGQQASTDTFPEGYTDPMSMCADNRTLGTTVKDAIYSAQSKKKEQQTAQIVDQLTKAFSVDSTEFFSIVVGNDGMYIFIAMLQMLVNAHWNRWWDNGSICFAVIAVILSAMFLCGKINSEVVFWAGDCLVQDGEGYHTFRSSSDPTYSLWQWNPVFGTGNQTHVYEATHQFFQGLPYYPSDNRDNFRKETVENMFHPLLITNVKQVWVKELIECAANQTNGVGTCSILFHLLFFVNQIVCTCLLCWVVLCAFAPRVQGWQRTTWKSWKSTIYFKWTKSCCSGSHEQVRLPEFKMPLIVHVAIAISCIALTAFTIVGFFSLFHYALNPWRSSILPLLQNLIPVAMDPSIQNRTQVAGLFKLDDAIHTFSSISSTAGNNEMLQGVYKAQLRILAINFLVETFSTIRPLLQSPLGSLIVSLIQFGGWWIVCSLYISFVIAMLLRIRSLHRAWAHLRLIGESQHAAVLQFYILREREQDSVENKQSEGLGGEGMGAVYAYPRQLPYGALLLLSPACMGKQSMSPIELRYLPKSTNEIDPNEPGNEDELDSVLLPTAKHLHYKYFGNLEMFLASFVFLQMYAMLAQFLFLVLAIDFPFIFLVASFISFCVQAKWDLLAALVTWESWLLVTLLSVALPTLFHKLDSLMKQTMIGGSKIAGFKYPRIFATIKTMKSLLFVFAGAWFGLSRIVCLLYKVIADIGEIRHQFGGFDLAWKSYAGLIDLMRWRSEFSVQCAGSVSPILTEDSCATVNTMSPFFDGENSQQCLSKLKTLELENKCV